MSFRNVRVCACKCINTFSSSLATRYSALSVSVYFNALLQHNFILAYICSFWCVLTHAHIFRHKNARPCIHRYIHVYIFSNRMCPLVAPLVALLNDDGRFAAWTLLHPFQEHNEKHTKERTTYLASLTNAHLYSYPTRTVTIILLVIWQSQLSNFWQRVEQRAVRQNWSKQTYEYEFASLLNTSGFWIN